MAKSVVRCGVYPPPEEMLPYVAVVITPQGTQHIASFWDEASAQQYVEKYRKNYVEHLSLVGKGVRG